MSCWDGSFERPEEERENDWIPPSEKDEYEPANPDGWRGDEHMEDWPLGLAGPEYWLYLKRLEDGEEGGDEQRMMGAEFDHPTEKFNNKRAIQGGLKMLASIHSPP